MVKKEFEGFYNYYKGYKRRIKLKVLEHYSNGKLKCSCCGEKQLEFLTLEHKNGGGNEHRRKSKNNSVTMYNSLIKTNFPEGYDVLCYNCNIVSGQLGICPHKKK